MGAVAEAPKAGFELIKSAHAQVQSGWDMPVSGQPIIATSSRVPVEVCRKYNLASRGDDGILKQAFNSLNAQCFGLDSAYRVVAMRPGTETHLGQAVAPNTVVTGDLPSVEGGEQWWAVDPTGELKVPTDPVKSGKAQLELRPATPLDFGSVQVGQRQLSESRLVVNTGQVQAESIDIEVPAGFGLASNTCLQGVMAGGSCSFSVEFVPGAARTYEGMVALRGPRGVGLSLQLNGEGHLPTATMVIPPFVAVDVGAWTASFAQVTNTGTGPLTITRPTTDSVSGAGFSFVSTTCPNELAAGARCQVAVRFEPLDDSTAAGTLKLTTSAGELTAALSGKGMQAHLVATPSALDFAVQSVNSSTVRNIRIVNSGNSRANNLVTSHLSSGYAIEGLDTCGSLAPEASCDLGVTFAPTVAGDYAGGTLVIEGKNLSPLTISLNGRAVSPTASLSSVAFGDLASNVRKDAAATLTNTGSVPLAVTAPTAASVQGAGFAYLSTNCPATLAVGASCAVNVRYTASGTATASGSLSMATSAGNLTANLTGQSQQAVLNLSPDSVDFGDVAVGGSVTRELRIKNTGNTSASVEYSAGGFAVSNSTCQTLAPAEECQVSVRFSPTQAGPVTGTLVVRSGPITMPGVYTATALLQGNGVKPSATLSAVGFGNVASGVTKDMASTLTNTGSVPLTVTSPSGGSVQGAGFAHLANNCPATLAVGASCAINIRYTAAGTAAASGSLAVATGAGNLVANLTGQSQQARVTAPAPVDFGKVFIGETATRDVTITNTGNVATSVFAITTTDRFELAGNGCGTLAPGASCTFSLQFSPTEVGSFSANVSVQGSGFSLTFQVTAVSEVGWDKTKISLLVGNCSVSGDQSLYDYHWMNNTNEMVGLVSVKYGNNPETLYPPGYARPRGPFNGPSGGYRDGPCGLPVVLKFSNGQTIAY